MSRNYECKMEAYIFWSRVKALTMVNIIQYEDYGTYISYKIPKTHSEVTDLRIRKNPRKKFSFKYLGRVYLIVLAQSGTV